MTRALERTQDEAATVICGLKSRDLNLFRIKYRRKYRDGTIERVGIKLLSKLINLYRFKASRMRIERVRIPGRLLISLNTGIVR